MGTNFTNCFVRIDEISRFIGIKNPVTFKTGFLNIIL